RGQCVSAVRIVFLQSHRETGKSPEPAARTAASYAPGRRLALRQDHAPGSRDRAARAQGREVAPRHPAASWQCGAGVDRARYFAEGLRSVVSERAAEAAPQRRLFLAS